MKSFLMLGIVAISISLSLPVSASPLLDGYAQAAKAELSSFDGFSAERGRVLFNSTHTTGKVATPSCTSCHTADPKKVGHTRAGKEIAPMAFSISASRYNDLKKAEKWFGRNCGSVLGRKCTAIEKGDFITFMKTQ